jgi:hypothetical protein
MTNQVGIDIMSSWIFSSRLSCLPSALDWQAAGLQLAPAGPSWTCSWVPAEPSISLKRGFFFLASFFYSSDHFFFVVRFLTPHQETLLTLRDAWQSPWEMMVAISQQQRSQQLCPLMWEESLLFDYIWQDFMAIHCHLSIGIARLLPLIPAGPTTKPQVSTPVPGLLC